MERDEKITLLFEALDNLSADRLTKDSWRGLVPGLSDERIEEITRFFQREAQLKKILPRKLEESRTQEGAATKPIIEPIQPVEKPNIKEETAEPRTPKTREPTEIKEQSIMPKKPLMYNVDLAKELEVDKVISGQGFELPPWDRRAIRQVAIQALKKKGRIERNDVEKIIQETVKDISSPELDKFINELSVIRVERREVKESQPLIIPKKQEEIPKLQTPTSPPPVRQPKKPLPSPVPPVSPKSKPSLIKSVKPEIPKPKLEFRVTKPEIQSAFVPKKKPKSDIPKPPPVPVPLTQQAKREPISRISEEVHIDKMQDISPRKNAPASIEINPNLKDRLDKVYSNANLAKDSKNIIDGTIEIVRDSIKRAKDDKEKDEIRKEVARYIRWREDTLRFERNISLADKVKEVRNKAVDEIYGG